MTRKSSSPAARPRRSISSPIHFGRAFIKAGDEIIVSAIEHHSNIVPWQIVADAVGAKLRVIPMNDDGELLLDEYAIAEPAPKLVAVIHVSNALGTINDVDRIVKLRPRASAPKC